MIERRPTRRALLAAGASIATAGCTGDGGTPDDGGGPDGGSDGPGGDGGSGDGGGDDPATADLPDTVALSPVAEGLEAPVALAHAPAHDLLYVVEQPGRVRAIGPDGVLEEPVLDLAEQVSYGGERGMLGLALDPEFPERARAYVRYSAPSREGTPDDYSHTFVCSSFPVSEDGRSFRAGAERTVLQIPEPQSNHNAGDLAFGPDGLLYVPTGDGGGAGDRGLGHPEDWYDAVPGGNGQDVREHLLGGVLRLDVHAEPTEHPRTDPDAPDEPTGDDGYAVPEENPLVGADGRDEYFAWGLRNPWRCSFDGDDLYVADVGQDDWEEVNRVERGGNYGWNVREGAHCFDAADCPATTPDDVRSGERLRDPVVEYPNRGDEPVGGVSVIGGHVYRGDDVPALQGAYVFGDLSPDGRLFAADPSEDGGRWPTATVDYQGALVRQLFAIGRDADDELYLLGQGSGGGGVWRVEAY